MHTLLGGSDEILAYGQLVTQNGIPLVNPDPSVSCRQASGPKMVDNFYDYLEKAGYLGRETDSVIDEIILKLSETNKKVNLKVLRMYAIRIFFSEMKNKHEILNEYLEMISRHLIDTTEKELRAIKDRTTRSHRFPGEEIKDTLRVFQNVLYNIFPVYEEFRFTIEIHDDRRYRSLLFKLPEVIIAEKKLKESLNKEYKEIFETSQDYSGFEDGN